MNSKRKMIPGLVNLPVILTLFLVPLLPADWSLVEKGQPKITIAVFVEEPDWLSKRAGEILQETIGNWSGVKVPMVNMTLNSPTLPSGPTIILTTASLGKAAPEAFAAAALLQNAALMGEGGFVCGLAEGFGQPVYLVVGADPRGLFNAAEYVREFLIDGPRERLVLKTESRARSPQMNGRPVYLLTIWGHEAEYTAADWEKVFDSFARDGFDRVYFWLSGHFPSKKYPQTYKVKDGQWDTTEKSRIGTVQDQRRILEAAHQRGLKIYIGGALGGWVGTRFLTNQEPETMKTPVAGAQYEGKYSLCPSHPKSRKALIEYYKEMYDALPDADGLFIESADEWGGCACERCSKVVDSSGSTYFGQAQLSLLRELAATVWKDHPRARFAYTIGYDEHKNDPAYYAFIKQMRDPRFEWMEARNSWEFPSYYGKTFPAPYSSRQVMRWQQYYNKPLNQIVDDAARLAQGGWYGMITAFEPGAGTGSFYKDIPYPTDVIPYVVTAFVLREAAWDTPATTDQMRERMHERFFGPQIPAQLSLDLWDLRELVREAASEKIANDKKKELLARVAEIQTRVAQARPAANPKAGESLELMQKAMDDIRKHLSAN